MLNGNLESERDIVETRAALNRALVRAYGRSKPRPYPSTGDIEELVHDVLYPKLDSEKPEGRDDGGQ